MAKCVCSLSGESGTSVSGLLRLSQSTEDSPTTIEGEIRGLTPGKHGITVNVYGDLSEGAASCGAIFNPFGKSHGSPTDENCMVGDLGNIVVGADGKSAVSITDKKVKLLGPHSVIGRSIVVYVGEDDSGKGGQETSLTTGNTGARVGAGVIGIAAP
mmetsp:Transcript_15089/g.21364  ORF Transcript_15089/g.21364 Transcript_15089/m.21364 type:complete len:157 (+) Transcript_15089:54-524(+)